MNAFMMRVFLILLLCFFPSAAATDDDYIAASANDADEVIATTVVSITSTTLNLTNTNLMGFRFPTVNVPKNATINSSYIQFYSSPTSCGAGNINVTIKVELADNSSQFAASNGNISGRTVSTTGNVTWATIDWGYTHTYNVNLKTSDLSGLVSQVTSRAGWAANNAMTFTMQGASFGRCVASWDDAAGAYDAQLHVDYTLTNLALSKTATASSARAGGAASNAVDGNTTTTRWESFQGDNVPADCGGGTCPDPSWLKIDLAANYYIGNVIIYWEGAYSATYEVQFSTDDATWNTWQDENAGNGGTDDISKTAGYGRYIRMYGQTRPGTYGHSLYELVAYEGTNIAPSTIRIDGGTTDNIAENAGAAANIGVITSTETNVGDTKTYSFDATSCGAQDNSSFQFSGTTLQAVASFDYETKNSYTACIKVTDAGGLTAYQALTISVTDVAEEDMNVKGNGADIADGDGSPSTSDHTDFGSVDVSGGVRYRTFTVQNTGSGSLTLSGAPKVAVSGTNAADFTVSVQPTSPVTAGSATTFTVKFDPSAAGSRTAALSIANSDADENPYNFSIQGTGVSDTYTGWGDSADVTMNTTAAGVSGNVYSFPLLVRLTSSNFRFAEANGTGSDIRFGKSTLGTHFPYEIERWDSANAVAEIWVLVDTVFGSNSTQKIRMYWSKSGAVNLSNSTAVFDRGNSFRGVWHMNDNAANTTVTDVVSANHGTMTSNTSTKTITGIVGKALLYLGTTSTTIADHADFDADGGVTISCWAYNEDAGGEWRGVVAKGRDNGTDDYWTGLWRSDAGTGTWQFRSAEQTHYSTAAATVNGWDHLAITFLQSGAVKYYLNGDSIGTATNVAGQPINGSEALYFGRAYNNAELFDGNIDEVRWDGGVRSTNWIKLSYKNQLAAQTLVTVQQPEMNVKGNGVSIADGDGSPSAADDTDFGPIDVTSSTHDHIFTIENLGAASLRIDGATKVVVGGTNAADFTVTSQPSSPVAFTTGTTTFTVRFNPSAVGTRSATLSIDNNDANEDPYNFSIQGTGTEPEMDVKGNNVSIADGDATPSAADYTDFGNVGTTSGTQDYSFTIYNDGNASLTLSGGTKVVVGGANAADFTVTSQPSSPVAASGNTAFTVRFDPSATGLRSATLSIDNDDDDENPYNFSIQGTGVSDVSLSTWGDSTNVILNTTASGANVTAANVYKFPVLVRLTADNFDFSQADPEGDDIRFAKPDGINTALNYEIDRWDTANKIAEIWVRVDTVLADNSTQYFRMYWNKSGQSSASSSTGTFSTADSLKGAWHMDDLNDATANAYNLSNHGASAGPDSVGNCVISGCRSFNGTDDFMTAPDGAGDMGADFTVMGWVKFNGNNDPNKPYYERFWSKKVGQDDAAGWEVTSNNGDGMEIRGAGTSEYQPTTAPDWNTNSWIFLSVVYNGTSATFYQDGALVGSGTIGSTTENANPVTFGYDVDSSTADEWDGMMDEVRFNDAMLSASNIKLCYENQKINQTLVSFSNPEDYANNWEYSTLITINTSSTGAAVTSDVIDFPLLVRLTSSNFDFSQAQSAGQDIRFAKSGGAHLKYEIEEWDASTEEASIWVMVDTVLGNNSSQTIRMHWGNPAANSRSSSGAVFAVDKYFNAVWHLHSTNNDATRNGWNLTDGGTANATGVIADGQDFTAAESDNLSVANFDPAPLEGMVSFWVKADVIGTGADYDEILGSDSEFEMELETNGQVDAEIFDSDDAALLSTTTINTTSWYHVAILYRATDDSNYIFINGAQEAANALANDDPEKFTFYLGRSNTPEYFDGQLDEVRVESKFRSAAWIKLCYMNQRTDQTLVQMESSRADYAKAVRLYFNTTGSGGEYIANDVDSIPILLRLDSSTVDFSATRSDGADIKIVDSSGVALYHEVVKWDKANRTGIVWTLVPRVEGNRTDDFIDLYYGCASCTNPYANADSVWKRYTAVFHLAAGDTMSVGRDFSGRGNHAAPIKNMPFSTGLTTPFAPSFDGAADYLVVANESNFDYTTAYTVSAWIKPDEFDIVYQAIVAKADNTWRLSRDNATNALHIAGDGLTDGTVFGSDNVNDGQWHYAVGIYDGANLILYVDGAVDQSDASTGTLATNNTAVWIGNNPGSTSRWFDGLMNEVRMAGTSRSADYIKLSYLNQKSGSVLFNPSALEGPVDVAGLQLWVAADSISGADGSAVSTWEDLTTNNRDLTTGDAPTLESDAASKINGHAVVRFNGTADYLKNASYNFEEGAFTVFVVAKSTVTNENNAFVSTGASGGYSLGMTSSGKAGVGIEGGTYASSNLTVAANMPYLYTFRSSGGTTSISTTAYLNGTTATSTLSPGTFTDGDIFMLGAADATTPNEHWKGDIAEVMVYNRRLDNQERTIVAHYLKDKYDLLPPDNIARLSASAKSNGIQLSWTRPVSTKGDVDSLGIWVGYTAYPDSGDRATAQLVGYFSAKDSAYLWPVTATATYYFTLLVQDSNGVWSDTATGALASVTATGAFGNDRFKKIRFNTKAGGADVAGNVSDFQLLVRILPADLDLALSTSDGRDIFFLDSTGVDTLKHQIEYWSQSGDTALIWVKVPVVSGNSSTDFIVMGYGNATRSSTSSGSNTFPTADNWDGVWHMDTTRDATANGNHATKKSADEPHTESTIANCIIGKCQDFDGANDYWDIPYAASLDMGNTFTVMFWMRYEDVTNVSGDERIFSRKIEWDGARGWEITLYNSSSTV